MKYEKNKWYKCNTFFIKLAHDYSQYRYIAKYSEIINTLGEWEISKNNETINLSDIDREANLNEIQHYLPIGHIDHCLTMDEYYKIKDIDGFWIIAKIVLIRNNLDLTALFSVGNFINSEGFYKSNDLFCYMSKTRTCETATKKEIQWLDKCIRLNRYCEEGPEKEFPKSGWCMSTNSDLANYLCNRPDTMPRFTDNDELRIGVAWNIDEHWWITTKSTKHLYKIEELEHFYKVDDTLILGKFKIDDIVISLTDFKSYRKAGNIYKVLKKSTKEAIYYNSEGLEETHHLSSSYAEDWRIATPEEKVAFLTTSINNISYIYPPLKNVNKKLIEVINSGLIFNFPKETIQKQEVLSIKFHQINILKIKL